MWHPAASAFDCTCCTGQQTARNDREQDRQRILGLGIRRIIFSHIAMRQDAALRASLNRRFESSRSDADSRLIPDTSPSSRSAARVLVFDRDSRLLLTAV